MTHLAIHSMFVAAGSLCRLCNFLPTSTKIALTLCFLFPILDHADANYHDHVSDYRKKIKLLTIRLRR